MSISWESEKVELAMLLVKNPFTSSVKSLLIFSVLSAEDRIFPSEIGIGLKVLEIIDFLSLCNKSMKVQKIQMLWPFTKIR